MKIFSFPEKEIENIKNILRQKGMVYVLRISNEFGEYKMGEFLKTSWGEKLVVYDLIALKDFNDLKNRYKHYDEFKNKNIDELQKIAGYKKIEIIGLKRYQPR